MVMVISCSSLSSLCILKLKSVEGAMDKMGECGKRQTYTQSFGVGRKVTFYRQKNERYRKVQKRRDREIYRKYREDELAKDRDRESSPEFIPDTSRLRLHNMQETIFCF